MVALLTLLMIFAVNCFGVLVYAITSFGNSILFHLMWHICTYFDSEICENSIAVVVIYVTGAAFFLFPLQMYILRKHINWPLAIHVALSQQFGLYGGMYILFSISSLWIPRCLGLLCFLIALQKTSTEDKVTFQEYLTSIRQPQGPKDDIITTAAAADESVIDYTPYKVDTLSKGVVVWSMGFISGVCGGLYATGGPPLMWFVSHAKLDSRECRGSFAFCYLMENVGRCIYILCFQYQYNIKTWDFLAIFVVLTSSSMCSLHFGNHIAADMNPQIFRRVILLLLASGSLFIGTAGSSQQIVIASSVIAVLLYVLTAWYAYRSYLVLMGGQAGTKLEVSLHNDEFSNNNDSNFEVKPRATQRLFAVVQTMVMPMYSVLEVGKGAKGSQIRHHHNTTFSPLSENDNDIITFTESSFNDSPYSSPQRSRLSAGFKNLKFPSFRKRDSAYMKANDVDDEDSVIF